MVKTDSLLDTTLVPGACRVAASFWRTWVHQEASLAHEGFTSSLVCTALIFAALDLPTMRRCTRFWHGSRFTQEFFTLGIRCAALGRSADCSSTKCWSVWFVHFANTTLQFRTLSLWLTTLVSSACGLTATNWSIRAWHVITTTVMDIASCFRGTTFYMRATSCFAFR